MTYDARQNGLLMEIRSSKTRRFVQLVIVLVLVLVSSLCITIVAAPRSPFVQETVRRVMGLSIRTWRFPPLASAKYQTCTVKEAWMNATFEEENIAKHNIEHQIRTLSVEGDLSLFQTPDGNYWAPTRDLPTLAEMIIEQRRGIYGTVQKGEVVIDVGSNIGTFTRRALRSGASLVIAIEITPEVITCFRRNFEREIAEGRVVLCTKGAWDKEERRRLNTSIALASTANSVVLDHGSPGATVELTTLDSIVAALHPQRVDLIKLDIEGAEPQALKGASATVRKFRPRLAVALEHKADDIEQLPSLIHRLWPDRQVTFGSCGNLHDRIQPQIAFVL
jgi:FkbM family methyltransferase